MPRLWVMKIIASPCCCCSSLSSARYWAWMVRSRLVVGSSAISRRGGAAIAIAPTTRWRMPPESWCGNARRRAAGDRLPHLHPDGEHRIERAHRVLQDHRDLLAADPLHLALALDDQVLAVEQH